MSNDPTAGAGEIAALWRAVQANAQRLEAIDAGGTRGIGAMSVQITTVIKDVIQLQQQLGEFQREHEQAHERQAAARVTARRWMVATSVAFLAAVDGPLIYLVAHVH